MKKDNKQRLFEMMGMLDKNFKPTLNENAFNSAGEPNMTHQQYRDYSEPSEPDYDDRNGHDNYDRELSSNEIVREIEKHFNTLLESYNDREFSFLTKGGGEIDLFFSNNNVSVETFDQKEFPKTNIEELDINDLFNFLEPYRQYILTGDEAKAAMERIYRQNASDAQYARQERSSMGG